jgi:NAD(P)-dependent dehydrogenase (short-subunit alcohol dehydrogenase family)
MAIYQTNSKRLALITGASKGLGLTLAEFLAAQGFNLIITARETGRLSQAKERLQDYGVSIATVAGDIADADHRRHLQETVQVYGGLDLLINNASTIGPSPMPYLSDFPLEELRQVFEVNTIAPLALTQSLRPLLATRQGLVVNLSSDAATGGYEGWGGYGASKAALDLISLTLANELQAEGISVVSVDPGDMRTAMHQDAFPSEDISDRPLPEVTLPFWAWLIGQERETLSSDLSGRRFQAQADLWEVPA